MPWEGSTRQREESIGLALHACHARPSLTPLRMPLAHARLSHTACHLCMSGVK